VLIPNNQLQNVDGFSPISEGAVKPNVSYSFSSAVDFLENRDQDESVQEERENEFLSAFNESGLFASLTPWDEGEMHIDARIVMSGNPAALIFAVITGMSLYVIPSWVTEKYTITAKVSSVDGEIHTYELEDSFMGLNWLPVIFIASDKDLDSVPTPRMVVASEKNIDSVSKRVRRNMWRNLILNMQDDGIIP